MSAKHVKSLGRALSVVMTLTLSLLGVRRGRPAGCTVEDWALHPMKRTAHDGGPAMSKRAMESLGGVVTLAVAITLYVAGTPTANADHCGDGCGGVTSLGTVSGADGRIDLKAAMSPTGRARKEWHGYSSVAFYVVNLGPRAITRIAWAPEYYDGWGCASGAFAWDCNWLKDVGRIEAGQRVLIEGFYDYYDEDRTTLLHDVEIDDSEGRQTTAYNMRIPRSGPIPTLVVRTSSKDSASCRESMTSTLRDIVDVLTLGLTKVSGCSERWNKPVMSLYIEGRK